MLTVPCPECGTKLLAPDSAVGQRLRCPKCGTLAPVPDLLPAEEVQVVDATVVKAPGRSSAPASPPPPPPPPHQPRPKPIVVEDPTADRSNRATRPAAEVDEEDEDRPRRRKRAPARSRDDDDDVYEHERRYKRARRKGGGAGAALVVGLVIGGFVALAGIGFAVYLFASKSSPFAKRAPVPAGWEQYSYPNDGFKLYLPSSPLHMNVPTDSFKRDGGAGARGGRFGPIWWQTVEEPEEPERIAVLSTTGRRGDVHIEVLVIKFRDRVPGAVRDRFRQAAAEGSVNGMDARTVRWLGTDALELSSGAHGAVRAGYTSRHLVLASISAPGGGRVRPEEEAGFFDNFEITN